MAVISKPTIVLVPGAWHKPDAFKPMASLLEAAGYTCVGVSLASVGAPTPLDGFDKDVEAIRATVKAEVDAQRDVVVLMHSYGSVPAGEAVKGFDKASVRKEGGQGGVTGLVYVAAFAPPKGNSLIDMLGGNPLPWFQISDDEKIVNPATPADTFYGDVADDLKASSIASLEPLSYRVFFSKTTWEPWRDIPSTYVYCTDDKAIPIQAQQGMVQATGAKWNEETLTGSSHSPFLSRPEETANAVRRAIGETI